MNSLTYPYTVAGIDPGPEESTMVKVTFTGKATLLESPLQVDSVWSLPNRRMMDVLDQTFGGHIVCEEVRCYGMTVGASVFQTVHWCGRFEERVEARGGKLNFIQRPQVKMMVCHTTRANDASVRAALTARFGQPGTSKKPGPLYGISGHGWAALAVCVAFEQAEKERLLASNK